MGERVSLGVGESIIASEGDMPWVLRGAAAGGSCGVDVCEWCRFGERIVGAGAIAWSGDISSGYLRFRGSCGGVESSTGDRTSMGGWDGGGGGARVPPGGAAAAAALLHLLVLFAAHGGGGTW